MDFQLRHLSSTWYQSSVEALRDNEKLCSTDICFVLHLSHFFCLLISTFQWTFILDVPFPTVLFHLFSLSGDIFCCEPSPPFQRHFRTMTPSLDSSSTNLDGSGHQHLTSHTPFLLHTKQPQCEPFVGVDNVFFCRRHQTDSPVTDLSKSDLSLS